MCDSLPRTSRTGHLLQVLSTCSQFNPAFLGSRGHLAHVPTLTLTEAAIARRGRFKCHF